jgi:transposase
MKLTEKQWEKVPDLVPDGPVRSDGKGQPWRVKREVLERILWIVKTGARWKDLPKTIRRNRPVTGIFSSGWKMAFSIQSLKRWQKTYRKGAVLTWQSVLSTAPFPLPKRQLVGKSKCSKSSKVMAVIGAGGVVLSVLLQSASPHEVTLVESTLAECFVNELPEKLIGDRAYDSDPLDEQLADSGVELIAPHKANRTKAKTQDGRKLRRYQRRWKVKRFFA